MTYAMLMVSLILGRPNARLLAVAADIAGKLGCGVIGMAACRPIHCVCRDYPVPASVFAEDRKQIERQIREAELEFRAALETIGRPVEWKAHTSMVPLAEHLALESRSADLVVIGASGADAATDATRQPDLCDLVMQAGRPVLVIPASGPATSFERVLVAWKDTRESRRAIADALPFLVKAAKVTVVEIAAGDAAAEARTGLAAVVAWLARHGVTADSKMAVASEANAPQLAAIARELKADLIVAGAYGYSRQGQWTLGGITAELLGGERCAVVSH